MISAVFEGWPPIADLRAAIPALRHRGTRRLWFSFHPSYQEAPPMQDIGSFVRHRRR